MQILSKIEKFFLFNKIIELISNYFIKCINFSFKPISTNGKVAIISLHKLGDTVFTIPAVRSIFKKYNDVYIITFPASKPIYNIIFPGDKIITISKDHFLLESRIADFFAKRIMKKLNPELIFDLTGSVTSATLLLRNNARETIGMGKHYFNTLYSKFTNIRNSPHLMDRYLDVVKLEINVENEENIKEFSINFERNKKILIHPFAGWKEKEWGYVNFIHLAKLLKNKYKVEIIAAENLLNRDNLKQLDDLEISYRITKTIEQLIEEIKDCSLFISNDSGPLYIASLLGKPTFTIYGPTNPIYSRPYGKYHKVLRKQIHCSPVLDQYCYLDGGRACPSNECLKQLKVSEVEECISSFIYELEILPNKELSN